MYAVAVLRAKILIELLSSHNLFLVRRAARRIAVLTESPGSNREAIFNAKGLGSLVSAIRYPDAETKRHAIRALANLAGTYAVADETLKLTLLRGLLPILQFKDKLDKQNATRAIAKITNHSSTTIILDDKLAFALNDALISLLKCDDLATKRVALRALAGMVTCYRKNKVTILEPSVHGKQYITALISAKLMAYARPVQSDDDSKTRQYAEKIITGLQKLQAIRLPKRSSAKSTLIVSDDVVEWFENKYPINCERYQGFYCPLGYTIMLDPVMLTGGNGTSYERGNIAWALAERPGRDPMTNAKLNKPELIANINLRDVIQGKLAKYPGKPSRQSAPSTAPVQQSEHRLFKPEKSPLPDHHEEDKPCTNPFLTS